MHELVWTQGAQNDFHYLYLEFEAYSDAKAQAFLENVDYKLTLLCRNPEMGRTYQDRVRRLPILETQTGIYYVIDGRRITLHIIASLHEPEYMIARRLDALFGD